MTIIENVREFAAAVIGAAMDPLPGSMRGAVNRRERADVVVTALAAGGILSEVLSAITPAASRPANLATAAVATVLVAIARYFQRLRQGEPPTPPAPPVARGIRWNPATNSYEATGPNP